MKTLNKTVAISLQQVKNKHFIRNKQIKSIYYKRFKASLNTAIRFKVCKRNNFKTETSSFHSIWHIRVLY